MSQWKGKLAGLVAAGLLAVLPLATTPALAEPPAVPEDIYQWVQSTARQNYYFNKQQMCYEIRADGTVDEHVLIVPTLRTYDDVQIQDVISKRRWKLEDLTGYDALAGAAEYLKIDLAAQTAAFWAFYAQAGLFPDYAANFVKEACFHPERFYRHLFASSDAAQRETVRAMLGAAREAATTEEEARMLARLVEEFSEKGAEA